MNANNDSAVVSSIVALYSFCGVPYVYGRLSPSGFDCSGFTSYCFKQNGIYIARNCKCTVCKVVSALMAYSNALPGRFDFLSGSCRDLYR